MGERTRAALMVLLFGAAVGGVLFLARSNERGRDTASIASAKASPKCRLVCHCTSEDECGIIDCTDDCHPADPSLCVDTMICPKGYVWSKADCSCNAAK